MKILRRALFYLIVWIPIILSARDNIRDDIELVDSGSRDHAAGRSVSRGPI